MELTPAVPCQALVIFDADFPEDLLAAGDQSRCTIAGTARDAIKAIMEGGEAAFDLRKEKYGF